MKYSVNTYMEKQTILYSTIFYVFKKLVFFFKPFSHSNIQYDFICARSRVLTLGCHSWCNHFRCKHLDHIYFPTAIRFYKSVYLSCYLKLFLARSFSSFNLEPHNFDSPHENCIHNSSIFNKVRLGGTLGGIINQWSCVVSSSLCHTEYDT